jgi:uncharacterized damage-inducible protein DinB
MGNTLNPYASFLGSQDPLAVIAATSTALQEAIAAKLSSGTIDVPRAAGTWTPRQILGHLADTEITFAMRLRQTAAEAHHVIQPFDQDAWNAANPHQDVEVALGLFQAVRRANVAFIQAQPEGMFAKPVSHPERGTMTFRTLVETMAGHDLNHLGQLK